MSFIKVDFFIRVCLTYNIHVKKYLRPETQKQFETRTNFGIQDFSLILKFVPFWITFFCDESNFLKKKIYHHLLKCKIIFPKVSEKSTKDCIFFFLHTIVANIFFKIITITLFLSIFYKEIMCMISCRLKTNKRPCFLFSIRRNQINTL